MTTWPDHVARWKDCTRCPLATQRTNIVLARGQVPCDVCFVGEAPGASEDALGQPFVGPAGNLLQQIIERALEGMRVDLADNCWRPVTYALTNLVACFPRDAKMEGYNEPEWEEILACRPRLEEFIALAGPKLVVRVGKLAADCVQHDAYGRIQGADVLDIVHPAAILRMPLAQKQMAVQRTVVQIRNAVEDMLG